jgi:hypothetical protein
MLQNGSEHSALLQAESPQCEKKLLVKPNTIKRNKTQINRNTIRIIILDQQVKDITYGLDSDSDSDSSIDSEIGLLRTRKFGRNKQIIDLFGDDDFEAEKRRYYQGRTESKPYISSDMNSKQ